MINNTHVQALSTETHHEYRKPPFHLYGQNLTEPLKIQYNTSFQQQKSQKKEKKPSNIAKNKGSHQGGIKIVQEVTIKIPNKNKSKHKKGKSMDLNDLIDNSHAIYFKEPSQKSRKVIINSNFLHQMRKRNINSQMKHYQMPSKSVRIDEKNEVKKSKKKKSMDCFQPNKKQQKHILQIYSNYSVPSHIKKKGSKHLIKTNVQQSLSFSTKLNKHEQKSAQLLTDRRCKSSLKEKKNSKLLGDLKMMGNSLPIPSKLNSLYSNTTSIYNSHNDLSLIQKKLAFRIPTQEPTEQIEEIRKYESLVLNSERSIKVLRNMKHQNIIKVTDNQMFQPENLKTEDIISNILHKFQTESQLEIIQPATLEQINEMYNQPSINNVDSKANSIENSLIQKLDSVSIDDHFKNQENSESVKLNEIIAIIENRGNNVIQKNEDKQYIIKTIKQILQNKKKSEQHEILSLEKYEPKQPKTKTYLDSNSLNTSSLSSSMVSQADISVLNLQILDKALRQREQYLQNRLKKEVEKIEEQQEQNGSAQDSSEIERVTKWIHHQIKEVHHTRTQLWKGFNVAKNLLKDELTDKNKQMMRCLSEKYIRKGTHKDRKQKEQQVPKPSPKQQSSSQELKNQQWSKLNNAVLEESPRPFDDNDNNDGQASPIPLSPLIQQNPLQLEDLRFLTSNDSNQYFQSQSQSVEQRYDEPEQLNIQLKIVEQNSSEKDEKSLKRERLNCESPRSDSQSESYGAIIIERQDTFLFSSQKKTDSKYFDLSIEDKEDICEFIFLDLCIEINEELDKDSKILQSLRKFIAKMKDQSKRQRGFKTNSVAIKQYLTNFITFLKNKPHILAQIHNSIDKPMGPTAIQILRYMHSYNEQIDDETESYILTAKIFDTFQDVYMKTIKLQRYYDDEERESRRRLFLKNAIHIHNKAIYDAYNEALDKDRPFGMWGEPFSWKKIPKFSHFRDTKAKNDILLKRAQQTIEISNFMCGFMFDKEDCALKDNPNVTDAYIEQIRYDRLSQMMAKQLEESEERMQFFDDQETQILVDMAQSIFTRIVIEISEDLMLLL